MDSILPILKVIPVFSDLTEAEHREVIKNIVMNYFPVGYVFFKQGDEAGSMYIIKKGMVRISRTEQDGKETQLAVLTNNDFFGEMGLVSDKQRNAAATAMDECEVFELKKKDFFDLMQTAPELANKVSNAFVAREKTNTTASPNEL